jgi:hypothetical protein
MQNFGVAFLIIIFNMKSPEKDYATLPLIAIALLTPLPFYLVVIYKFFVNIFKTCQKKLTKDTKEDIEENGEMIVIKD